MRTKTTVPLRAALLAAAALAALPAGAQRLSNHPVPTAVSGKGPTTTELGKPASSGGAVQAVTIGEDSDDPCHMEVKFRDVATGAEQSSLTFGGCAGRKVGDLLTASLPQGVHVTGVRVCLNSRGDKMKGLQLVGSHGECVLGADSVDVVSGGCSVVKISGHDYRLCDTGGPKKVTLSCSVPLTSYVERPNCRGSRHDQPDDDWEKLVSCREGMVATGVKLRTVAGSGKRRMIQGVALTCDTLVPAR